MTTLNLRLRPGEKFYLNGAVIKVDRRVTIEVLNDVTFLLQSHVLQVEDAITPLKQLYFAVQSALMDPKNIELSSAFISDMLTRSLLAFSNKDVIDGLLDVKELLEREKYFESLRVIRALFPVEAAIIGESPREKPDAA